MTELFFFFTKQGTLHTIILHTVIRLNDSKNLNEINFVDFTYLPCNTFNKKFENTSDNSFF